MSHRLKIVTVRTLRGNFADAGPDVTRCGCVKEEGGSKGVLSPTWARHCVECYTCEFPFIFLGETFSLPSLILIAAPPPAPVSVWGGGKEGEEWRLSSGLGLG